MTCIFGVRSLLRIGLMTLAVATCLACALAPPSWAESEHNYKGASRSNEKCIETKEKKKVVVRGVNGNQLESSTFGLLYDTPECEGGKGVYLEGIESISAGGKKLSYTRPSGAGQYHGFVWLSELAKEPPAPNRADAGKGTNSATGKEEYNGEPATSAPGEPYYSVTPVAIAHEQCYNPGSENPEKTACSPYYEYAPYGQPTSGARYALMTWSWIEVAGGGIARAAVAEGQHFYPTTVAPITKTTVSPSGAANGTVTAVYGFVNSGEKLVYGWMVMSHTYDGVCSNHMGYVGGTDGPLTGTLCPGVSTGEATGKTPTGATLTGKVYPNGSETHYYFQYGTAPCGATSCGSTSRSTSAGSSGEVSANATVSLSPGTTYHYRVVASSSVGTSYGSERELMTPCNEPIATTGEASAVEWTAAMLNGEVNPNGCRTTYRYEYGTSIEYEKSTPISEAGSGSGNVPLPATVTGLEEAMTYHFRLAATNSEGTTRYGVDKTLTTRPGQFVFYSDNTTLGGLTPNGSGGEGQDAFGARSIFLPWGRQAAIGKPMALPWSYENFHSAVTGRPAALVREDGEQMVFYNDAGKLDEEYTNAAGEWKAWESGDAITGNPVALLRADGEQFVFYNDGGYLNEVWTSSTGKWEHSSAFGQVMTGDPAALIREDGEQMVFVDDGGRLEEEYDNSESEWKKGGPTTDTISSSPVALLRSDGEQFVFYDNGGYLNEAWWAGTKWEHSSSFKKPGTESPAAMTGEPAAVIRENGEQSIYYDDAGTLEEQAWVSPGEWKASSLGLPISGNPSATISSSGEQVVLFDHEGELEDDVSSGSAWTRAALGERVTAQPAVETTAWGEHLAYFDTGEQLAGMAQRAARPAALVREDGEQMVFYNDAGKLDEEYTNAAGEWKAWESGDAITGNPVALLRADGEQFVFYNDGGYLNEVWTSSTGKWEHSSAFGQVMTGDPAALIREDGEQMVFVDDGGRLEEEYDNSESEWKKGGPTTDTISSSPVALLRSDGEQFVFYDNGGYLNEAWWAGTKWEHSSSFKKPGTESPAAMTGEPAAVIRENGEQSIYYDDAGTLEEQAWVSPGEWKASSLGLPISGNPSATISSSGEQYVFLGNAGTLEEDVLTGGWSHGSLGRQIAGSPVAVTYPRAAW
jgi:hypothetical protein